MSWQESEEAELLEFWQEGASQDYEQEEKERLEMEELLRVWKEEASSDFEVEQKARRASKSRRRRPKTPRKSLPKGRLAQEDDLSRSTSQEWTPLRLWRGCWAG